MPINSIHVFDRKGKTLYTKSYARMMSQDSEEQQAERRKLVFGMLYSLREVANSLSPKQQGDLRSIQTGASTLHVYETKSGMRFALFTTGDMSNWNEAIQTALQHVYLELWVQGVTRSPLYRPTEPNVSATNFESRLDFYLKQQPWFK
jgi:trafficking protein particle complex subunit 1